MTRERRIDEHGVLHLALRGGARLYGDDALLCWQHDADKRRQSKRVDDIVVPTCLWCMLLVTKGF